MSGAFASPKYTDIQDPKTNADEILFLSSNSFECNLYIEKAGQSLLDMAKAEQTNNLTAMSSNYIIFVNESNKAIAICRDVSMSVTNNLIDIQSNVEIYYKLTYK